MKVVLLLVCVAFVAAFAEDVDMDFVKQAMAFKKELAKRDAKKAMEMVRREMVQLDGVACAEPGEFCGIFQTCCNSDVYKCNNFMGGECVLRD